MGDLTKNFSRSEFECKCGCGFDDIDQTLVEGIQQIRDKIGVPLYCVRKTKAGYFPAGSGCRCRKHNSRVRGSRNSQHILGKAADIWGMPDIDEFVKIADTIPVFNKGGIGVYKSRGFVHLDVRGSRSRWTG